MSLVSPPTKWKCSTKSLLCFFKSVAHISSPRMHFLKIWTNPLKRAIDQGPPTMHHAFSSAAGEYVSTFSIQEEEQKSAFKAFSWKVNLHTFSPQCYMSADHGAAEPLLWYPGLMKFLEVLAAWWDGLPRAICSMAEEPPGYTRSLADELIFIKHEWKITQVSGIVVALHVPGWGRNLWHWQQQRTWLAHIQLLMKGLRARRTAGINCGIKPAHWPIKTQHSAQLHPDAHVPILCTWIWEKTGVSDSFGCLQATEKWSSHKAHLKQQGMSWKLNEDEWCAEW